MEADRLLHLKDVAATATNQVRLAFRHGPVGSCWPSSRFTLAPLSSQEAKAISLPWYIMTSPATHQQTVQYFKEHDFLGYPEGASSMGREETHGAPCHVGDVFFFQQSTLPCLTEEGKMLLAARDRLAMAPDGNGGLFRGRPQSTRILFISSLFACLALLITLL